jgi:sialic acid synthase SpsE
MTQPYIIAEAAQGFEGNVEVALLLARAAHKAGANAIKYQLVYADDLAEKDYEYYGLFKSLEMSDDDWCKIREYTTEVGLDLIFDIFGSQSLSLCSKIKPDGLKIHSTCFFDEDFIAQIIAQDVALYLSIGGIYIEEVEGLIAKFDLKDRENFTLMYGFQAEPTPIESNNLSRIPALKDRLGIKSIGFMDHSDGDGQYKISLSAVALGMGVNVFEKHITLDRALEMEDYISALSPQSFALYVQNIAALSKACGADSLNLTEQELAYRNRAIKRVVAARRLEAGTCLDKNCIKLSRSKNMIGAFKIEDILQKKLISAIEQGDGIDTKMVGNQ